MSSNAFADGRAGIDASLVRRLIDRRFPRWSGLPVTPVEWDGWDNRTYRLGDDMSVRLPTAAGYAPAVVKENEWLPVLAPGLPLPIPVPLGLGAPDEEFPHPWSVRRWLDGETATAERVNDMTRFAVDLARFLKALRSVPADGGPAAGAHSFHRGAPPARYHDQTVEALDILGDDIDTEGAATTWQAALEAESDAAPAWFHGDIAPGNLLVRDGRLSAVIDFGTCGVGDPACDLVIAWTFFTGESREAFRREVDLDEGAWRRARGWALWKALICLSGIDDNTGDVDAHRRVIATVVEEDRRSR
ncbi:aminoglycoside phosphotransferase family protein [Salininema proteolyticum]|uniref:Aminoglycoside phosphotransferase family protein n=1 Tax=Salininema proteolyticum TaxID=1607685 RepID=A0ABV8TZ81_9ACTN